MPGQRVRTVRAFRTALATGKPDSRLTLEKPDTVDALSGDLITSHFDTVPPKYTSKGPALRQLLSLGHALSRYHIALSDTSEHRTSLNYTSADTIIVDFDSARPSTVAARGGVKGIFVEPNPDTTKAKP